MKHLKEFCLVLALLCPFADGRPVHAESVPSGCAFHWISVAEVSGSPAYVRLRYEIEALASAQAGVTSMVQGLKEFKTASEPSMALSAMITSTNDGNDALHCSAAIMDRYTPTGVDDGVIKALLIQVFNEEATVLMATQADVKKKILVAVGQSSQTSDVAQDAENMSAMQAKQKDAAESLTMAFSESLMLAVDLSDMKAKNTAKTTLSCGELKDLQKKSAAIVSNRDSSIYHDDASLFNSFLNAHECKAR